MEDFDANIEDQKEEVKKDTAEEEESELVGDTSPISNKMFVNVSEGESQSYKCQQPIAILSTWILIHTFLVICSLDISRRTLMLNHVIPNWRFLRICEYMPQMTLSVEHGNMPLTAVFKLQYTVAMSSRLSKNYAKWRDGKNGQRLI